MKILVFGAYGMAGHMVAAYLNEHGENVIGFARQDSPVCNTWIGDAMNAIEVEAAIRWSGADVVVNCIGVLNRAVDNDMARGIYLNGFFPHLLENLCRKHGKYFIHISTDCVFNGKKGAYTETDQPDEISAYGRTKTLGEILENSKDALVFRTSIVGPELKENGVGLFEWFMKQKGSVDGYRKVLWSGVTTLELAKAIRVAAHSYLYGIYNLVNNEDISKYELLCLFNKYFRQNELIINPVDNPTSNKTLRCTRTDFHYEVSSYEEMLSEMFLWMEEHSKLYERYGR